MSVFFITSLVGNMAQPAPVQPQFTLPQRRLLVNTYIATGSYVEAKRRFRNRYPGVRVPWKNAIVNMVKNWEEEGTVKNLNKERSGRRRTARSPANVARVQRDLRNGRTSARKNRVGLTKSSFNRTTRDLGYHPFRIQNRHALQAGDQQRRLTYSRWLVQRPRRMNGEICIIDEANFRMNGSVCTQNVRYYAQRGNPPRHFTFDRPNNRQKLNVLAAMVGNNTLIGPIFIDGNLTGEKYLTIVNQEIEPILRRQFGALRNGAVRRVWFFQDGATPHRTVRVRYRMAS